MQLTLLQPDKVPTLKEANVMVKKHAGNDDVPVTKILYVDNTHSPRKQNVL